MPVVTGTGGTDVPGRATGAVGGCKAMVTGAGSSTWYFGTDDLNLFKCWESKRAHFLVDFANDISRLTLLSLVYFLLFSFFFIE